MRVYLLLTCTCGYFDAARGKAKRVTKPLTSRWRSLAECFSIGLPDACTKELAGQDSGDRVTPSARRDFLTRPTDWKVAEDSGKEGRDFNSCLPAFLRAFPERTRIP